jgi:hypothetical protein
MDVTRLERRALSACQDPLSKEADQRRRERLGCGHRQQDGDRRSDCRP